MKCPKCPAHVSRTRGCNKMHCPNCEVSFCFSCGADISQQSYLHFWNPDNNVGGHCHVYSTEVAVFMNPEQTHIAVQATDDGGNVVLHDFDKGHLYRRDEIDPKEYTQWHLIGQRHQVQTRHYIFVCNSIATLLAYDHANEDDGIHKVLDSIHHEEEWNGSESQSPKVAGVYRTDTFRGTNAKETGHECRAFVVWFMNLLFDASGFSKSVNVFEDVAKFPGSRLHGAWAVWEGLHGRTEPSNHKAP